MQRIAGKFEKSTGKTSYTASEVARWAIDNGLWKPKPEVIIQRCASDLSKALREEYAEDPSGGRFRTKHVALLKKDGEQMALWADMRKASRSHMERAFQQRRKQIVGDCKQLKTDADCYNDNYNTGEQISIIFDFTKDLKEANAAKKKTNLASSRNHRRISANEPRLPSEQSLAALQE